MSFPIVALWSPPHSAPAAFERIMRARGDVECLHEPFMYDYSINRSKRQAPHFDAMDQRPRNYDAIRAMILEKAEKRPVFFTDMSYCVMPHIAEDQAFFKRISHSFLIRDPKASILSYAKFDPDMSLEEIGLEAQWHHAQAVMQKLGLAPVVIRSEQVQADPEGQMRKYWQALGLSDKPEALHWNDPAPEDCQQVQGWHGGAMSSTTIRPITADQRSRMEAEFRLLAAAEPRFGEYLAHHLPYYTGLARFAR